MSEKQLEQQLTYQVFHIGVYVSLATALIGAAVFKGDVLTSGPTGRTPIAIAIVCRCLAGMCGAMVASKIPEFEDYETYKGTPVTLRLLFWELPTMRPKTWESLEHFFFWISMILMTAVGVAVTLCGKGAAG